MLAGVNTLATGQMLTIAAATLIHVNEFDARRARIGTPNILRHLHRRAAGKDRNHAVDERFSRR
jgi:hypothetical protein